MLRLLLSLPFVLLPLTAAQAHEHDNLGKHEHGVASLNLALDGGKLEIGLQSPAMNIVGFEHAPSSAVDDNAIATARAQLENPAALFKLPAAAGCSLNAHELHSPLLEKNAHEHDEHSDFDADYRFTCTQPEHLQRIDLSELYRAFPSLLKVNVQLIGPNGQQGIESTAANPHLSF
jgi:hypothetical protein